MTQATTIGALRETGYRPKSVKEELRANLCPLSRETRAFQRHVAMNRR